MKKRDKEIVQLIQPDSIISGSIAFNVDSMPRIMRFGVSSFYTVFEQEDLVRIQVGNSLYDVLIIALRYVENECFVRGLIKSEKVLA